MSKATKDKLLDPVLHETSRLMLVSVLNACGSANFSFLLASTDLSRGNFTTHMRRLVQAGYVEEHKRIVAKRSQTDYRLTTQGRAALRKYKKDWARVVSGEAFEGRLPSKRAEAKQ